MIETIVGVIIVGVILASLIAIIIFGFRIVRPTQRALVERFGKYHRFCVAGLTWVIPFVDRMIKVNITERMMDVQPQDIITKDNLNARVDLVVYYQVKPTEADVKKSRYNVDQFETQIISLSQTTARNVIGDMVFKDVNNQRNKLNKELAAVLDKESDAWGVKVVRVELKEIQPPRDVQDTMNRVIKAENLKDAAKDEATARETLADGVKRANIKEAEGIAQGKKIVADANAYKIKIVADANAYKIKIENEAAKKYFEGNAQKLKQFEVTQTSLQNNSKIVLGQDTKNLLKLFDISKL